MLARTPQKNLGGQRLHEFLVSKGWTPRKLGRELDCDQASVNSWISGRNLPALTRAIELETICGVDPRDWVKPPTISTEEAGVPALPEQATAVGG
jgi:hypothetical protein